MSDPLSGDDLKRVRDGGEPLGPPCYACGAKPQLESDGIGHIYHAPDCPSMARIQRWHDEQLG